MKRITYAVALILLRIFNCVKVLRTIILLGCALLFTSTMKAQQWWNEGAAGFSDGIAICTSIAIDGSGTPYVVYKDCGHSGYATVMKYNGSNWEAVGTPGFSASSANYTTIAIDGSGIPYVAYTDNSNKATVMKFTGSGPTEWETVGSAGFSEGTADNISIALYSKTPYVVYKDYAYSNHATVMKYNGSSWVAVGSPGFSSDFATYTSIAIDGSGTPYVVYSDNGQSLKATVMKYTGSGTSGWEAVGSPGISAGQADYTSIAIDDDGNLYVVYSDIAYSRKATALKFSSGSWAVVGSAGFSAENADYTQIAIDGSGTPYVVYSDNSKLGYATVMKYSGSWSAVGSAGFSAGKVFYTSIAIAPNGIPVVAYEDYGHSGKATVMKFSANESDPLPVELKSFTAAVNQNVITLKWITASEVNNYGFEIQRSEVSGQKSDAGQSSLVNSQSSFVNHKWQKLGFVDGHGNSNSVKNYSFADKNVSSGKYCYRLKQIDNSGEFKYSNEIEVEMNIPKKFVLEQNYPNPFNPSTAINYQLSADSHVLLKVYNILGQEVRTLVNEDKKAGAYTINFDASGLSSGTYFYNIKAGNYYEIKKMIILK